MSKKSLDTQQEDVSRPRAAAYELGLGLHEARSITQSLWISEAWETEWQPGGLTGKPGPILPPEVEEEAGPDRLAHPRLVFDRLQDQLDELASVDGASGPLGRHVQPVRELLQRTWGVFSSAYLKPRRLKTMSRAYLPDEADERSRKEWMEALLRTSPLERSNHWSNRVRPAIDKLTDEFESPEYACWNLGDQIGGVVFDNDFDQLVRTLSPEEQHTYLFRTVNEKLRTALGEAADHVPALNSLSFDLTGFTPHEARGATSRLRDEVRICLRQPHDAPIKFGLRVDEKIYHISRGSNSVTLASGKQWRLFKCLLDYSSDPSEKEVSEHATLEQIERAYVVDPSTGDAPNARKKQDFQKPVSELRKRLEQVGITIKNRRGKGYFLKELDSTGQ